MKIKFRQELSRKGISMIFVYLFLLLIALFSGLIVRFMAGSLIQDHIQRTLGLRLMLHGVSIAYNTMYSMPSGETSYTMQVPSQCTEKCVDCNATIIWNPFPTRQVTCNCNDTIKAENALLSNYPADTIRLVCDDYIIENLQPVILFYGNQPLSAAIKARLYIHPQSEMFWIYDDNSGVARKVIEGMKFYDREITIFTEMPLNLNDYSTVNELLTPNPFNLLNRIGDKIKISRTGYDNYDSIRTDSGIHGLIGLVDTVFNYTKGNDPEIELIIPPGMKLVKESNTKVCQYQCYNQNALESECPNNEWHLVECYDFGDLKTNKGYDYEIKEFCPENECIGNVTLNYELMNYYDVLTGTRLSNDEKIIFNEFTLSQWIYSEEDNTINKEYCAPTSGICKYCDLGDEKVTAVTCPQGGELKESGCLHCYNKESQLKVWNSQDCQIRTSCSQNELIISISKKEHDIIECYNNDICLAVEGTIIYAYTNCDSSGDYKYLLESQEKTITIKDRPATTYFQSLLVYDEQVENYEIITYGTCLDNDFKIELVPQGESRTSSKILIPNEGAVVFNKFKIELEENENTIEVGLNLEES